MTQLSDFILQVRELVHDLASTDWTDSELTVKVNESRTRIALDRHCVRSLFLGLNLATQTEIYPINGGVAGISLLTGGSGYTSPAVAIGAPPAGGVQATAIATQANGVVNSLVMTNWGSGYTAAPTATITDGGPGVGATASTTLLLNIVDIISCTVLYPGNQQALVTNWLPFTYFQAWIRMNRQQFGYPNWWTTHTESNRLFFGRPPDQPYTLEIDAAILPTPLVNTTDVETQILPPFDDAVKWYAASLAMVKLQNFEQSEYFNKRYEARIQRIADTRMSRRIPNVYNNSIMRMIRGW